MTPVTIHPSKTRDYIRHLDIFTHANNTKALSNFEAISPLSSTPWLGTLQPIAYLGCLCHRHYVSDGAILSQLSLFGLRPRSESQTGPRLM
jgi:hypothetical protein